MGVVLGGVWKVKDTVSGWCIWRLLPGEGEMSRQQRWRRFNGTSSVKFTPAKVLLESTKDQPKECPYQPL